MVEIDVSFGATNDAFAVVTEFSLSDYAITADGDLQDRSNGPFGYTDDWRFGAPPQNDIYVGAYVNAKSNDGLVVEFDSVTVETIPEPAVISLIAMFGGGMFFSRRIFGRKKADIDL